MANFKVTFPKILYYFIYYNYIFEFVLGEGSDVHIMVQNHVSGFYSLQPPSAWTQGSFYKTVQPFVMVSVLCSSYYTVQRIVRCLYLCSSYTAVHRVVRCMYYAVQIIQYSTACFQMYILCSSCYTVQRVAGRLYYIVTTKDDLKSLNLLVLHYINHVFFQ